MDEKRCIIHMPFFIDLEYPSGSQLRPVKIIEAFKKIGFSVDVVMGYGEERKKQIEKIIKNIKNGVKYEFLYSEGSTEPTLLTEKNHLPKYPFMDFRFIKFCKKQNIRTGLFYRDVYWRFPVYKQNVSLPKRLVATFFYKYDLFKYNQLLDVLYLPTKLMYDYIPFKFNGIIEELPPGIDGDILLKEHRDKEEKKFDIEEHKELKIFYVGGINTLYNLEKLFEAVHSLKGVHLTVCCREKDWETSKGIYAKYLSPQITIVHKSGHELEAYFKEADVCGLYFEPIEYRKFAMPVKLFEYMSYKKPIIATKATASGEFVEKNNIGWNIGYSVEELMEVLNEVKNNRDLLIRKTECIEECINKNTWETRARKVYEDLRSI